MCNGINLTLPIQVLPDTKKKKTESYICSDSNNMKFLKISIYIYIFCCITQSNTYSFGTAFLILLMIKNDICQLPLTRIPTKTVSYTMTRIIVEILLMCIYIIKWRMCKHFWRHLRCFLCIDPPLYDNLKFCFVRHLYVIVCFCYTFVYWEVFWVKLFNILHC